MVNRPKISIIGTGPIGTEIAHLLNVNTFGDVVIIGKTAGRAKSRANDINELSPMLKSDVKLYGSDDFEDIKDSDIVVIATSNAKKEGMTRNEYISANTQVVANSVRKIVQYAPDAIIIVMTNPVDVMTYIAKVVSGSPREKVMGVSSALDSSLFRKYIANELGVSIKDVQALVIGGHGDKMVPLPRLATVSGVPLGEWLSKKRIKELLDQLIEGGAELAAHLENDNSHFAPAAAAVEIIESILKDEKRILPCTVALGGEYGISGLCLGVPVKIGAEGAEEVIQFKLLGEEKSAFKKASNHVKEVLQESGYLRAEKKSKAKTNKSKTTKPKGRKPKAKKK